MEELKKFLEELYNVFLRKTEFTVEMKQKLRELLKPVAKISFDAVEGFTPLSNSKFAILLKRVDEGDIHAYILAIWRNNNVELIDYESNIIPLDISLDI
ncbi:hypothetical protein ACFLZN_00490 [Nanoarchaeota archaeon]